ncbi:MAG: vitamin K epoxide reductase family protein [Gemmatimonadetes bacterium]|nr:vitamin K epoxide reductase family protein [Gemmatimonadota bacterium]
METGKVIEGPATESRTDTEWSPPGNRMGITILSFLGVLVATYLLFGNLGLTGSVACGVGDCATVQASQYSRIAGIPVSAVGLIGYVLLFALALLGLQPAFASAVWLPLLLVMGSVVGVLFSAYLTYLEAFVIRAWCQWCVVSAVIMTLIFCTTAPELGRIGRLGE